MSTLNYFLKFKNWMLTEVYGRLFMAAVVIPVLCVACYLWVLTPDRYESSATLMIKESAIDASEMGLLQALTLGGQGSSQDEQLLQAYVGSADLLSILISELEFTEHFSHSWDFVFGISQSDPREKLLNFYQQMVTLERDVDSGLLVLRVHAYSPEFAKNLTDSILKKSEEFINKIGNDVAHKEMLFAQSEIGRSQQLLKKAKSKLLFFQNKHTLVSPDSEGQSLISIVYGLEADLAKTQAELIQSEVYLSAKAPQSVALKSKAMALKKEIALQKQRITGVVGESTDDKLIELGVSYQDLVMDVELATTLYKGALTAFEVARSQAGKQLKYLIVASRPQLPEESLYPKKFYWIVSWAFIFTALFSIIRLIVISINEHRD